QAHEGRARTSVLESVRRRFHQIRGSAATFGFPGIGDVAAEAESLVRDWLGGVDSGADLDLDHIRAALGRIAELLKNCDPPSSVVLSAQGGRADRSDAAANAAGRVLLLHTDRDFVDGVVAVAARRGYEVESFSSPVATLERLREQRFEIVTIGGQPARQVDCEWVRFIRGESADAAVVLLGGDGTTEHRVTAAQAGVDRYIAGASESGELVREWEDLSAAVATRVGRVMVVDDDPAILEFVEANLRRLGCEVVCLDDAAGVFESLERTRPDLLLLDVDMPSANGLEVTRAIRASEQWVGLPIVIQTAHTSPEYRLRAFESGADDFITKPILEEELSARVLGRLERERVKHDLVHRDPVTDLICGQRFADTATAAFGGARTAAAATFEIRGLERFVARFGPAAGDAAMRAVARTTRSSFRSNRDVLARVAPHVVALIAPGISVDEAAARVDVCLRQLEGDERLCPSGSLSDGVEVEAAVVPMSACDSVEDMLERALGSGRAGRRCRLRVEQGDAIAESNRVYLVEDDASLRELLGFALENAGYRVTAFAGGHEALRALTRLEVEGDKPLVLLDVELPGVDGFRVLEELVLERPGIFRVVMLTANDGPQERTRALRAGATDFIAKPLRVPELLSKISRIGLQRAESAA
ncbi:MAG: response regulator, partial [Candidatus Binatia bacterium]